EAGVLGVLPGLVGIIQASEAIKLLLGVGQPLTGRLLTIDLLSMRTREFSVPKDESCPACGSQRGVAPLPVPEAAACVGADGGDADAITATRLRARLERGDPIALVDVRMPWEWSRGHLDDATLIPLTELDARLDELDEGRETVVYCAVGVRSAHAVRMMRAAGFSRARNLTGGIQAWLAEIGPPLATD
ncbi:MAG: rhodanese-like domain-containing protein, partial [Acidobacteriota bacterium]|nr:rhodanese-like domain-containing protein [Acidobacteriota bacterium]